MIKTVREVEEQIAASGDEKEKLELMLNLIGLYFRKDIHKALAFAEEVYPFAQRVGSEKQIARARANCGEVRHLLSSYLFHRSANYCSLHL